MKKEIKVEELKQIQLDILKFVDKFCKENNLKYFLAYGTLLGAVRHKGYIPWDDDIDIIMFREDYEKFVTTFKDVNYKVFATEVNSKYPYPFAKVGDTRTYYMEEIKDVIDTGVNIDVFPLDYLPENRIKDICNKRNFLQKVWLLKRLPLLKRRGLLKNIFLWISQIILLPFSIHYIVKKLELNAKGENLEKSTICGNIVCGYDPDVYPSLDFENQTMLDFEDASFPCPRNYDHVLKIMFGDYMKLPPVEKQVSHHHFISYWK